MAIHSDSDLRHISWRLTQAVVLSIVLALLASLLGGCATRTGEGALIGGALGSGTGLLLGGPQAAIAGGLLGGGAGALLGATQDGGHHHHHRRHRH